MSPSRSSFVANLGVTLSALALVPSAGSFTPAIGISVVAALIGAYAISKGRVRRGVFAIYLGLSAVVVSPILLQVSRVDLWLIALSTIGVVLGFSLIMHHLVQLARELEH